MTGQMRARRSIGALLATMMLAAGLAIASVSIEANAATPWEPCDHTMLMALPEGAYPPVGGYDAAGAALVDELNAWRHHASTDPDMEWMGFDLEPFVYDPTAPGPAESQYVGQNCAAWHPTSGEAVDVWINSVSHYREVLRSGHLQQEMLVQVFCYAGRPNYYAFFPARKLPTWPPQAEVPTIHDQIRAELPLRAGKGFAPDCLTNAPTTTSSSTSTSSSTVPSSTSTTVVVPPQSFVDVRPSHVFYEEIQWSADAGVTVGYPGGLFRPTKPVSRQAMAAFMVRLAVAKGAEVDLVPCSTAPFSDVEVGHPFCAEIAWLAGEGIIEGYSDGRFRPAAAVTRQATSAFLARFLIVVLDHPYEPGALGPCRSRAFFDVVADHPFCSEIRWLDEQGIVEGYSDGRFRPTAVTTRQAAAAFLAR